jgi:3-methylcrotonyl-CoA carboxylase alpha subunit
MPKILEVAPPSLRVELDGKVVSGHFFVSPDFIDLHLPQGTFRFSNPSKKTRRAATAAHEGGLTAPMPGKVVKVLVKEGSEVKKGDLLMILEAMKMEHKVVSPKEGKVKSLRFREGDRVSQGEDLVELES